MRNTLKCAAGAGAALILVTSASVLAQTREQTQLKEIVRKAEAREPEGRFCSTTGWPPYVLEGFLAHLKEASVGSWKVNNYASGNCQLDRVTAVHMEKGDKCVAYSYWACNLEGGCVVGEAVDCVSRDGKTFRRR